MCIAGRTDQRNDEESLIPVVFDVCADEYLFLLKKKGGRSWKEFIFELVDKNDKEK